MALPISTTHRKGPGGRPTAATDLGTGLTPAFRARVRARPRAWAAAGIGLACLALAAASLALPSTLDYDPWNWVIWGREVWLGNLNTHGGTAWKPLPVLFTTLFGPAGALAPWLWLVVARAGALASLVLAYRVGSRLGGRLAGVLAAASLLLLVRVLNDFYLGSSEGLLVALCLGAVDRHLAGRRTWALVLGFTAGLLRPEAWPLLIVYGAWLWRGEPRRRPLIAGLAVALPALWFVPEWIGAGAPFAGLHQVRASLGARKIEHLAVPAWLVVLGRGATLLPGWVEVAAAVGVVVAIARRDRRLIAIVLGAVAWLATVAAMAQLGYPGMQRFLVPVGAAMCLLAGVAGASLATWVARRPSRLAPVGAGAVGVAGLIAIAHGASGPLRVQAGHETLKARQATELMAAVRRTGGPRQVLACGRPETMNMLVPPLHWALGPGAKVGYQPHHPPFIIFAIQPSPDALPNPAPPPYGASARGVARAGQWGVLVHCRRPDWRPQGPGLGWGLASSDKIVRGTFVPPLHRRRRPHPFGTSVLASSDGAGRPPHGLVYGGPAQPSRRWAA